MKYYASLFILVGLSYQLAGQVPTINSFNPSSGPIGTEVTIEGANFSTTPSDNVVYFGATRAMVSAASSTQLTVTVPVGATYQLITVTVNGLTAYADEPFLVTFACPGVIDVNSFSPQVDFTTGQSQSYLTAVGDLDGDGKLDLAVGNYSGSTISVFRNTSSPGEITENSFAAHVDFESGGAPAGVAMGDFDGDGKLDLAVANQNSHSVSVFRNTATVGTIDANSFAPKIDLQTTIYPAGVAIGDLDADGRPDIVAANNGQNSSNPSSSVSVFKNTTPPGSLDLSFALKEDFVTGLHPLGVNIRDLDGDGKPDLVVASTRDNSVSVLKNITSTGVIGPGSFAEKIDLPANNGPVSTVGIGDLDGDGKQDLAVVNAQGNTVSLFRNTTTPGTMEENSFGLRVDLPTDTKPLGVAIADLDGDGKPDLAVAHEGSGTISVFRNTSTVGAITENSFAARIDYPKAGFSWEPLIGDIDGDGKPDLIFGNGSNSVAVFRNEGNSSLDATLTTSNDWLYFGYLGDQTATIKAQPECGAGPYSVSITMNRPLNCNVITSTGDEKWINGSGTTSSSNITCPASGPGSGLPASSSIVSSGGYYQVTVSLMQDAIFTATITDANGITITREVHVDAEDVRCFAGNSGNQKVAICHQTGSTKKPCGSICVSESAVDAHLAHGDFLGNCTIDCTPPTANARTSDSPMEEVEKESYESVEVYPNPVESSVNIRIRNPHLERVTIHLVDFTGKSTPMTLPHPKPDEVYVVNFEQLPAGLYYLNVRIGNMTKSVRMNKK